MNNKKWIKILLVLCILGFAFVGFVNYIVDPYGFNNKVIINKINSKKYSNTLMTTRFKANILENGNFDTIMLGTSRIGVINPDIVNKYLNSNTFNLDYPASNTIIQNKFFKYATHYNEIKYLIYSVDFLSFNKNKIIKNDFKEFYELEKKIDNFKTISNYDIYFNIETFSKSIKLVIKNILNKQPNDVIYLPKNGMREYQNYIEDDKQGKFDIDESISNDIKSYFSPKGFYYNYEFSYEYLEHFKNTIEYCKKNNIEVFVYMTPLYSELFDAINSANYYDEFEKFKKEIVKITDFIDFTGHTSITTNKNNYWDASHLKVEKTEEIMKNILNFDSTISQEKIAVKVTKENIDEHLENLRKQIQDYDLNKTSLENK